MFSVFMDKKNQNKQKAHTAHSSLTAQNDHNQNITEVFYLEKWHHKYLPGDCPSITYKISKNKHEDVPCNVPAIDTLNFYPNTPPQKMLKLYTSQLYIIQEDMKLSSNSLVKNLQSFLAFLRVCNSDCCCHQYLLSSQSRKRYLFECWPVTSRALCPSSAVHPHQAALEASNHSR